MLGLARPCRRASRAAPWLRTSADPGIVTAVAGAGASGLGFVAGPATASTRCSTPTLATAEGVSEGRVLDRSVAVVERPGDGGTQWNLVWQHAGGVVVDVRITGVDAAAVPWLAAGIRELPAEAWRSLTGGSG